MDKNTFKTILKETGEVLTNNGTNTVVMLRELQSALENHEGADQELNFMCFFLHGFIDDVFYNITGDFPYNEKRHDLVISTFKQFGVILLDFANRNYDRDTNYNLCIKLVNEYIIKLEEIKTIDFL